MVVLFERIPSTFGTIPSPRPKTEQTFMKRLLVRIVGRSFLSNSFHTCVHFLIYLASGKGRLISDGKSFF